MIVSRDGATETDYQGDHRYSLNISSKYPRAIQQNTERGVLLVAAVPNSKRHTTSQRCVVAHVAAFEAANIHRQLSLEIQTYFTRILVTPHHAVECSMSVCDQSVLCCAIYNCFSCLLLLS